MLSNAVSPERVSRVVGYEVLKGNFGESTPNLPQRVAIFGQANTSKQGGLTNAPVQVTSEQEAGEIFGFGSQIHQMMRIIRSRLGDVTGGIPTVVYPQLEPAAAEAEVQTITVGAGPANNNAVHIVKINGRSNFDGASLEISVADTETVGDVAAKIADAINAAQSCPVSASVLAGVVTLTTKWKGESAGELNVEVDTQDSPVNLTYTVDQVTAAAGDSSAEISASLLLFGNIWNTIVINPYPQSRNPLFEAFNGIPGETPASGRYGGEVFKPFVCLSGNTDASSVANVTANLLKDQATVVQCPAPNSKGWSFEAAANVCTLLARQAQNDPHLDTAGKSYPDMPVPEDENIGVYTSYNNRDLLVKSGASTVTVNNGRYQIEDLVTTYHPDGEIPPQFRYVRSLIQDWNIRYGYLLLELVNVVDKAILQDGQPSSVAGTVSPNRWRAIVNNYFNDLADRAIIVDVLFSSDSLLIQTNDTNPDRLETFFRYKRSPFARIASTTGEAGFAFGLAG